MYNKLNNKILNSLTDIAGKDNILTGKLDIEQYAADETPGIYYPPEAVVRLCDISVLYELIKLANAEKFSITARGGGTGLSGGCLPLYGGVVISFERLNKIIDIDSKNRMAVVEPGVINSTLQQELKSFNLFYPINPASMESCTMGGNVAESTGGANTVRYGTTRNYLTGMKSISGKGDIWQSGGKIVKNSSDQILMQLMCGSEGILSIFTELTFRLIAMPLYTAWIIAPFTNIYKIPETTQQILKENMNPTMLELMDSKTLDFVNKYLDIDIQFSNFNQLLVRFDSNDKIKLEEATLKAGNICIDNGASDVLVADKSDKLEKLWKIRSSTHDAIVHQAKSICEEDVVVPPASVGELLKLVYNISEKYKVNAVIFGHLGDGNIHLNFTAHSKEEILKEEKIEQMKNEIFKSAIYLGGKVSGEHGIGITKKQYFNKFTDPVYIKLLKQIKKQFDPNYILNPGKIFDFS